MKKRLLAFIALSAVLILAGTAGGTELPRWKILWLITPKVHATLENGSVHSVNMVQSDILKTKEIAEHFDAFLKNTITAATFQVDIYEAQNPITHLTKDEYNGYWVAPEDLPNDAKEKIEQYDCVITTVRLADTKETLGTEWWGLGTWKYCLVQLLPGYEYWYFDNAPYPEEVYVHEWIHILDFWFENLGYKMPGADSSDSYGYVDKHHQFYCDILTGKVLDPSSGKYIGVTKEMWAKSPLAQVNSDFELDLSSLNLINDTLELEVNQQINKTLKVNSNGSLEGLTFKATGLPSGFTLTSDGQLSGASTMLLGSWPVTVTASTTAGLSDTKSFTIKVTNTMTPYLSLNLSNLGLVNGKLELSIGQEIQATITVDTNLGTTISYKATGLPSGFSLSNTGSFSGRASVSGRWNIKITATSACGRSDSTTFILSTGDGQNNTNNSSGGSGCNTGLVSLLSLGLVFLRKRLH